ncbi:GntR family transcriptional regulator [Rhizobium panacihumi]|uniref:GntR family transcriptional regulator n=1 Tax=Rhizobium panacihumi TaxID=2008450 RepID=UPI003D7A01B0
MTRKRSEHIQESLEDDIVTGRIAPGTRLEEVELATRFDTSRTPVREALHKLAAAGLIQILPRKGAIVPRVEPQTVLEMFEVMAEMEAATARLAARRLTDVDRVAIAETLEDCRSAALNDTPDAYYHRNEEFHQSIYRASHNLYLQEQCNALLLRLSPFRRLQLRLPNRIVSSLDEHEALVAAIFETRHDDAARIARDHVQVQGSGFNDFAALLRSQQRG